MAGTPPEPPEDMETDHELGDVPGVREDDPEQVCCSSCQHNHHGGALHKLAAHMPNPSTATNCR